MLVLQQSRGLIEQHMQKMKTLSANQSMEKLLARSPVVTRQNDTFMKSNKRTPVDRLLTFD